MINDISKNSMLLLDIYMVVTSFPTSIVFFHVLSPNLHLSGFLGGKYYCLSISLGLTVRQESKARHGGAHL